MQLTYTYSRAICIQDPSSLTGISASEDPFQSSFRSESAPSPTSAPVVHPSVP